MPLIGWCRDDTQPYMYKHFAPITCQSQGDIRLTKLHLKMACVFLNGCLVWTMIWNWLAHIVISVVGLFAYVGGLSAARRPAVRQRAARGRWLSDISDDVDNS